MSALMDRIVAYVERNVSAIRGAPGPFAIGVMLLVGLATVGEFAIFQWGYSRTIEFKNSNIETLTSQIGLLNTDDNLLRQRLGLPSLAPVDSNAFYQGDVVVAHVTNAKVDTSSLMMEAKVVDFNLNFIANQNVYFRTFELRHIGNTPYRPESRTVKNSKWEIVGRRPAF